jgi:hypothetical protein
VFKHSFNRLVVFAGPSKPEIHVPNSVEIRPPARRGDLFEFLDDSHTLILLADGTFFHHAAPSHYELLAYLSRHPVMFGTASMGALRAAELGQHGMKGLGTVFTAISKGHITDDAELAVGMCPFTYAALTVSLVNVRRLLFLLRMKGFNVPDLRLALDVSRKIYFLDRTAEQLARAWSSAGLKNEIGDELLTAWRDNSLDVKTHDTGIAIRACLELLGSRYLKPLEAESKILELFI